ncbi:site-2 protease family protein [Indiicoccus explosivorum]|uniref:site-2 protease family protein n=1 Tax=Indiicoccus explosivorum TaxID=1917864 RepID=UPI000B446141
MEGTKKQNRVLATLSVVGLFIATKLKFVLAIVKFAKLQTLISMFLSLGFYAVFFGWKFGVALIYVLFIHEMGHLAAARIKGIKTSPAIFVPFMGAVIGIDPKAIKDARTESFIAYGGPLAGLLSILPAIPLYWMTEEPLFALIIYLGAFLNLFNLLPVSPLDGGRIVASLSTALWGVGIMLLIALNFFIPGPMLLLITIIGAISWVTHLMRGRKKKQYEEELADIGRRIRQLSWKLDTAPVPETEEEVKEVHGLLSNRRHLERMRLDYEDEIHRISTYYKTDIKTKIIWATLYIGLIGVLAFIMISSLSILETITVT